MHNSNIKIGENICNNIEFLKQLSRSTSEQKRRKILKTATNCEILSLVESALNIVKGRFCLTTRQKTRIDPYKNFLRQLSRIRSEKVLKGNGIGAFAVFLTPIIIEALKQLNQ